MPLQRDASDAKSMLATANIRYAELTDRLDEEKRRAALLEVSGGFEGWEHAGSSRDEKERRAALLEVRRFLGLNGCPHACSFGRDGLLAG